MRYKPCIVWMIVALLTVQQSVIAGRARHNDTASNVLPRAGSVYADAQHDRRILRVTDDSDALSAGVIATTSFNADATRFVISLDGAATLYRFDAAGMTMLKEGPLFDGETFAAGSLQWSADAADTIFGLDTTSGAIRLAAYDVVSRRSRAIKDFSDVIGRGEVGHLIKAQASDDRFAFAWREAAASEWRAIIVWDRPTDRVYSFDLNDTAAGVANFTDADFNQTGEALVINGATSRVWRFATQSPRDATLLAPADRPQVAAQSATRDALSVVDEEANTLSRARLSRDGRFALFSAGAGGSRQDVFIAGAQPILASTLVWTNLINCSARDNSVQKTGGNNNADDASATSLQTINGGDAYVEFTALETDKERFCGLSSGNAIHASADDINFAIKLNSARKAVFVENGIVKGKIKYKPDSVFRIAVESNVVHYYKNGELIYTSQSRPAYPMLVTASLVNTMASVNNVMIYGAGFGAIVSINPEKATVNAGQSVQFTARVTGTQTPAVNWSADGGTITGTGLYTAPATAGNYTVKAALVADPRVAATARVTVRPVADTTPPVISGIASSGVTANAATVTWTTDEPSDSTVEYGASTAYGASATNAARVISHSLALSGLVASTTYHFRVKSRDAAGNLAISGDQTFTTTAAGGGSAPVISVLSTGGVTTGGATVTWTTDSAGDTQVEYGASASYGNSTPLNPTRATSHTATLTGLAAGAMYHFRVKSRDAAGNLAASGDQTFMTASTAGGGGGGTDPLKTDRNVYPEPPPPALPAAGGTLVDPVFGTTILRVTDERDSASNYNSYSYWPSLNRNSTRLVVFVNNGNPVLYDFDPVNFRISNKRDLFRAALPGGGHPWTEDVIWSGNDADVIYCHSAMKIYAYNVAANSYTLVKDLAGQAPGANLFQMSKSVDDNAFGFTLKDANWNIVGYMAWQQAQNNLYVAQTSQVDEVQIDKSGQFLTVMTGDQGVASTIECKIVNLQTRSVANITDGAPDFSPGHHDSGSGVLIGNDNWNNALNARQLANPHQFFNVLSMGNDWSQSNHVSLLDDGDGWLLVSMFVATSLPNSGLFKNELVLVATDGSQRVRRLAHHHSVFRDYWDTPRADISRDGQFAVFTSNWGSTSRRDVFIVKIPPPPSGSGGGDTTPPVISAVAEANVTATGATINWATNEPSDTQVEYGATASYGSSTPLNPTRATSHTATLSGFVANTTYHFRVKSRDAAGNLAVSADMLFTTPGSTSGGGGGGGGGSSQNVVWTSVINCTASGNTLQKTGGRDDTADAGARSQQSLTSGDGYLQFTAQEANKLRFCGLARNPAVPDFAGIDYAIKLTDFGIAEVREANLYKTETPYAAGDVFRISVEGGVVKYYKNGAAFYTSARAVSYPLVADTSFIAVGGTIASAVMAVTTGTLAISNAPQRRSAGASLLMSAMMNEALPMDNTSGVVSRIASRGGRRGDVARRLRALAMS
jgi:Immunoglobulin I-set domain